MIDERACLKSSIFPIVMAVSLVVEYQSDSHATVIDIFPLTSEEMSITGQWCARRSRSVVEIARWLQAAMSNMPTSRIEILRYRRSIQSLQLISQTSSRLWFCHHWTHNTAASRHDKSGRR